MNFYERALSPLVFGAEIMFYFEKSPTPKSGENFLAQFFTLTNFLKNYLGYQNFILGKKMGLSNNHTLFSGPRSHGHVFVFPYNENFAKTYLYKN